jgi:hypothetical protein
VFSHLINATCLGYILVWIFSTILYIITCIVALPSYRINNKLKLKYFNLKVKVVIKIEVDNYSYYSFGGEYYNALVVRGYQASFFRRFLLFVGCGRLGVEWNTVFHLEVE